MRNKIGGIIPPLVTPLIARDELDVGGLERLIEHVIGGGVSGIFILGTTGEAPSLSYRLRREMIQRTIALVDRRVTVLVGVADTAFVESVRLARFAAEQGADAAVLTTPYYFPAGQTELTTYVRQIVAEMPLPVVLYNMPGLTKVWYEVETLKILSSIESIVGIKDSSGDLSYFERVGKLKSERPDWSVMIGPEAMLRQAHRVGGDGGVCGGANVFPEIFVTAHAALCQGNDDQFNLAQTKIERFQAVYEIGKYASRHIKATKCALSILGICSDLPADPFHRFLEPHRQQVAEILSQTRQ